MPKIVQDAPKPVPSDKVAETKTESLRGKRQLELKFSFTQGAVLFHTTRETLKRRLERMGIGGRADYTIYELHCAMSGDLLFERTRRERAEADTAEVEAAKAKLEVIHQGDVATFIRNTFAPVREDVLAMPSQLAARCNPANPELARAVLLDWGDVFLRRRRENLPAFKVNGEK